MSQGNGKVLDVKWRVLLVAAATILVLLFTQGAALCAAKAAKGAKAAKPKLAPGEKININTATAAELDKLPEIGPVKAKAIIAGRPYKTPKDIMKVKGIKEGIYNKIKDNITVR